MAYIAQTIADNNEVELFIPEITTDIDGNEVTIKRSIGVFSVSMLESEKASLQLQIDDINEKLLAISSL